MKFPESNCDQAHRVPRRRTEKKTRVTSWEHQLKVALRK